jgi:hypothetical protein
MGVQQPGNGFANYCVELLRNSAVPYQSWPPRQCLVRYPQFSSKQRDRPKRLRQGSSPKSTKSSRRIAHKLQDIHQTIPSAGVCPDLRYLIIWTERNNIASNATSASLSTQDEHCSPRGWASKTGYAVVLGHGNPQLFDLLIGQIV